MKYNLLICTESLRAGGAERLINEQLEIWDYQKWNVNLMVFSGNVDMPGTLNMGVKLNVLGECSNWKAVIRVLRFCHKERIELAICHLERPNKWMGLGARLARAQVVTVVHNIGLYDKKNFLKKALLRLYYRYIPSKVVAVSEGVSEYLCEFGIPKEKITVIRNGINVRKLRERWGSDLCPHENNLCVLARLEPAKGLDLLLKALSQVVDYSWKLKIIGEGSCYSELKHLTEDLELGNRVSFLGYQSEPFPYLNDVNIICMPSLREGLPMALLECQALGIPAIVSDAGYLPRIIVDGHNGFVCNSGSVDSLKDALVRFFSADQITREKMIFNAKIEAERYDINECVSMYMGLAESFCGKS